MSRAFIIDPTISAIDGLYDLLGIGIPNQGGILYSSLEYFSTSKKPWRSWQQRFRVMAG